MLQCTASLNDADDLIALKQPTCIPGRASCDAQSSETLRPPPNENRDAELQRAIARRGF